MSVAYTWHTTAEERGGSFACDGMLSHEDAALFRAITIDAPAELVFRWLCQLRLAPYSYDWIDNFGRQSPQELTAGLEDLVVGQRVMRIFDLVSFETDRHVTIRMRPGRLARLVFGDVVVTYHVDDTNGVRRLIAKVVGRYPASPIGWLMKLILPWGDLVMMRKQFINLKRLAERDARAQRTADAGSPMIRG